MTRKALLVRVQQRKDKGLGPLRSGPQTIGQPSDLVDPAREDTMEPVKGSNSDRDPNRPDAELLANGSRVACASCGKMMMPTATLCGFCWRRRGEPITAKNQSPK